MKIVVVSCLSILALVLLGYCIYVLSGSADPTVAAAAIAASSTVIVSTATVTIGRYFEKKKELEALHREKKIPIYGKFLDGLFAVFYNQKGKKIDVVKFLQDWQQQIVLWGGPKVVNSYIAWKNELTEHEPDSKSLKRTDDLILAIREELGHNDKELAEDIFPRFILREYKLYAELLKAHPNLTLAEFGEHEKRANER